MAGICHDSARSNAYVWACHGPAGRAAEIRDFRTRRRKADVKDRRTIVFSGQRHRGLGMFWQKSINILSPKGIFRYSGGTWMGRPPMPRWRPERPDGV